MQERDTEERARRQVWMFSLAAMAALLVLLVLGGLLAVHLIHPALITCGTSTPMHC